MLYGSMVSMQRIMALTYIERKSGGLIKSRHKFILFEIISSFYHSWGVGERKCLIVAAMGMVVVMFVINFFIIQYFTP